MPPNNTSLRVLKNTGYLYVKLLVSMCLTLFTTRIVLKSLGAVDYGIFGVVGSAIAMLGFLNASMASATQRFMNYYEGRGIKEDKIKIYNSSVIIHIVLALTVGFFFLLLENVIFGSLLKIEIERLFAARWIYRITILSTMVSILTVPFEAIVNSHEDLLFYSIVGIIDVVLKFLFALYVSITPYDKLIVYGISVILVTILTFFMMLLYCKRKYDECIFRPKSFYDRSLVEQMFKFGGWNLIGTSTTMVSNYGIGIVINRFFGTIINATQTICNQVTSIMMVLSTNMMKAVNPVIVKREGMGNRTQMFNVSFTSCKMSFLTYVFIGIPFFVECKQLLTLWLDEVPPFCLEFCQLAFFLKLIEQITTPLGTSIAAVGKIKVYNIVISCIQAAQIVLVIVFFAIGLEPYYSVVAMIVAASCCSIFKIIYCKIHLGMDLPGFIKSILNRCLLHSVICVFAGLLLRTLIPESLGRLALVVFVVSLLNAFMGYFVLLNKDEKSLLKGALLSIKNR